MEGNIGMINGSKKREISELGGTEMEVEMGDADKRIRVVESMHTGDSQNQVEGVGYVQTLEKK